MQLEADAKKARIREQARLRGQRYRARNVERVRELARVRRERWNKENPIGWRAANYKYLYKITPDDYRRILEAQGRVCAICACPPGEKLLHIDHNHETGVVRGLLCRDCNLAIGHFKENEEAMKNAVEYLRSPPAAVITHAA